MRRSIFALILLVLSSRVVLAENVSPQLGACLCGPEGSVVLDADASPEKVERIIQLLDNDPSRYNQAGVISNTAANGNVSPIRPIIVTYSFVPDGTAITGASFVGDPAGPSDMFAKLDATYPGGRAAWQTSIRKSFNYWSNVTGLQFVEVSDDGAPFPASNGVLGLRGDLRIGMHPFMGAPATAYAYFPNRSDLVFDSADVSVLANSYENYRIFRNIVVHESGHSIGFNHTIPGNGTKIMEVSLPITFDGLGEDDIRGGQRLYGDDMVINDSVSSAISLGVPPNISNRGALPRVVPNLALEKNTTSDYFSFGVPDPGRVSIVVRPVGTTYAAGPDGGTAAPIPAGSIQNIAFHLINTNGSSILSAQDSTPAGGTESLDSFALPGEGVYFLRVFSTGGADDVQRYEIEISLGPVVPLDSVVLGVINLVRGATTEPTGLDRNSDGDVDAADAVHRIVNPS